MLRSIRRSLICSLFLVGCISGGAVVAINPLTGERRSFDSEDAVPDGWIACASEETCPAPRPCGELDEGSCLARSDCSPTYVGIGAYPRECDGPTPPDICDGEAFAGCTDTAETCEIAECGPAPLGASWLCPDGSVGGVSGRCIRSATTGTCGWEIRECPMPPPECESERCGPAPGAPAYICPDGTIGGNTGRCLPLADGSCGWEFRECPAGCESIPACRLACPPGTVNPVDESGCVHTCECVPAECSREECGPAPEAPEYVCPDGSIGGNTGHCLRAEDGSCGWEMRECPPAECTTEECGPALGAPSYVCPDGSAGGNTGRCLRNADGACGWEMRECPSACAEVPACDLFCPPGTHNPVDEDGCEHTCECVRD